MQNNVVRRKIDLGTHKAIADEEIRSNERPRELSRALPKSVKTIETVLIYRPKPGHPDPGARNSTGRSG